jgi:hypothetical protein
MLFSSTMPERIRERDRDEYQQVINGGLMDQLICPEHLDKIDIS